MNVSTDSSTTEPLDEPPHQSQPQRRTPFLDNLLHEQQAGITSFHMPGHKHAFPTHPDLGEYWGNDLFRADLVEINGSVDYLHAPKGSLLEAQRLAAHAFGADQTFFLINGSTVGNLAAIMSTAHEGVRVIVPRASHRSVYGGLVLAGATPVYVEPVYHPQVGFPLGVDPAPVKALLQANPNVVAVHVTSPNYYGYGSDVGAMAALAHEHGAILIVDEAHGSHFTFHPDLPTPALHLGADVVIQSTHKTLTALTQCSMLHVRYGRVNTHRLGQMLTMLQSSSPNSILLASLDAARMQMAVDGRALLDCALELAHQARAHIREIDGLWCYGDELVGEHGIAVHDPMKLLIRVSDIGLSGFQAANFLRTECRLNVEFADLKHVICSLTVADTVESVQKLLDALHLMASRSFENAESSVEPPVGLPHAVMSLREGYFAPSRRVRLDEALGQVCAESIIPYPPGIPLILPGEMIDADMLHYLQHLVHRGMSIVGPEDTSLDTVRVVA